MLAACCEADRDGTQNYDVLHISTNECDSNETERSPLKVSKGATRALLCDGSTGSTRAQLCDYECCSANAGSVVRERISSKASFVQFQCSPCGSMNLLPVKSLPSAVVVASVDKASCFSKTVDPAFGLGPGDLILELKDFTGDSAELIDAISSAQLNSDKISLLVVRRPISFAIRMYRVGHSWKRLGLSLSPDKFPKVVSVEEVQDSGLVSTFNEANPERMILKGDLITSINNISGHPALMLQALQNGAEGSEILFTMASGSEYE